MKKVFLAGKSHPSFEQIMEQHKDVLTGIEGINNLSGISTKLGELGYDVLFNNKKAAEFVPAGRLNEVVAQRDQFKSQVETLGKQLEAAINSAKGNETLQKQLQELKDGNDGLLAQIEQTKIETEILLQSKDAHDAKAVLPFVDKTKVKIGSKGEVIGVKEEVDRLRKEMPFLFGTTQKKGGLDKDGKPEDGKVDMNFLIRRKAGNITE